MSKKVFQYRWYPKDEAPLKEAGVYLLHGTGEHAARYERLAQALTDHGFRVAAHDHPGHGKSSGKRGVVDPPGALVTQAGIQVQSFAAECGAAPILFGHSLGGVVAAELVLEHRLPVTGLILSAPAFAPYIGRVNQFKLKLLTHIAPLFTQELPYDASRLTHDEAQQKLAENDPLNHGYKSASLISWLVESGRRSLDSAHQLDVDSLLLIAGSDPVVSASDLEKFSEQAPSEYLTTCRYADFRHEILNETPERRQKVVKDILGWLSRYP